MSLIVYYYVIIHYFEANIQWFQHLLLSLYPCTLVAKMHGRLKVKTTAEKEAEKNREREKKKLIYQKCMNKIKGQFNSGERSVELLNMITKVLENIPEFGTLWNWRRVVLLEIFNSCGSKIGQNETETSEQQSESAGTKSESAENESESADKRSEAPSKAAMIVSEKLFVARCLEVNPKAYSLWSHRRWLVEQDPSGSWWKKYNATLS